MRSKTVRSYPGGRTCARKIIDRYIEINTYCALHTPKQARQIADALHQMADEIDGEKT